MATKQPVTTESLIHEETLTVMWDTYGFTPEQVERADRLAEWITAFMARTASAIIPKAIAYGSADLELMGKAMSQVNPKLAENVDPQELAIWFYVLGKVARLEGGYVQGIEPDVDSWYDLFVYSLMAHYVREHGGW